MLYDTIFLMEFEVTNKIVLTFSFSMVSFYLSCSRILLLKALFFFLLQFYRKLSFEFITQKIFCMQNTELTLIHLAHLSLYECNFQCKHKILCFVFFFLVFVSQTFTNHKIVGEGRGHFINSSLSLLPVLQTLRH